MSTRVTAAVAAICFAMPAAAATVKRDVMAVLTQHSVVCDDEFFCRPPEEGIFKGLYLNVPVKAFLDAEFYDVDGFQHQKYSLTYSGGGIGYDSTDFGNNWAAFLGWSGDSGGISYSLGNLDWRYTERATIKLTTYIAPVPLPAGAALLPFGIAALTIFRKRRKQS